MFNIKRMREKHDERYETAKQIALAAGVLKECEYHKGLLFRGDKSVNKAFAMANDQYLGGKYYYEFRDKKDMTDTIIEVVRKYSSRICSSCGHSYEE